MTAIKSSVTTRPSSFFLAGFFGTECCSRIVIIEFLDEIGTVYAAQRLFDAATLLGLVPEEILALGQLLLGCLGAIYAFERVRVVACVPGLSGIGEGRRRKVLHLLEMEIEVLVRLDVVSWWLVSWFENQCVMVLLP